MSITRQHQIFISGLEKNNLVAPPQHVEWNVLFALSIEVPWGRYNNFAGSNIILTWKEEVEFSINMLSDNDAIMNVTPARLHCNANYDLVVIVIILPMKQINNPEKNPESIVVYLTCEYFVV